MAKTAVRDRLQGVVVSFLRKQAAMTCICVTRMFTGSGMPSLTTANNLKKTVDIKRAIIENIKTWSIK
jgi:hypothetical protein